MTETPTPEVTELNAPYWDGLRDGELRFQRCDACGAAWLPAREQCPQCLAASWQWTPATGRGRLISWVIYRQSMHAAFTDRLPYNVAVVELDEGPRLISNILADEDALRIELPLRLVVGDEDPPLARFAPEPDGA